MRSIFNKLIKRKRCELNKKTSLIDIISLCFLILGLMFILNADKIITLSHIDRYIDNNVLITNYDELDDYNQRVGISINTIDGKNYGFIDATLQHNSQSNISYAGEIMSVQMLYFGGSASSSRWLHFSNVIDGIYTLTINTHNYPQYTDDNFIVNHDREMKDVLLLPRGHEGLSYTIENNTSQTIHIISLQLFSEKWLDYHLEENLLNNQSYIIRPEYGRVPERLNIRLTNTDGDYYTKYGVEVPIGSSISFTNKDKDIDKIWRSEAIIDSHKFDIIIHIQPEDTHSLAYATLSLFNEIKDIVIKVNNEELTIQNNYFSNNLYWSSATYDFNKGKSYQIEIISLEHNIAENIDFTIPHDLAITFPDTLDNKQIDITWQFTSKHNENNFMSFYINEKLQKNSIKIATQKYTILSGTINKLKEEGVEYKKPELVNQSEYESLYLTFYYTTNIHSGRVIVYNRKEYRQIYMKEFDF